MARKAIIERKTSETQIRVELDLDGSGKHRIDTPLQGRLREMSVSEGAIIRLLHRIRLQ